MKAFAVELFKGKHPEAGICRCAPAPAPEAGRLPRLAPNPQAGMEGGMEGWGEPASPAGRVERSKTGFAKLAAVPLPCSFLPACPEANVILSDAIGFGCGLRKALALPRSAAPRSSPSLLRRSPAEIAQLIVSNDAYAT